MGAAKRMADFVGHHNGIPNDLGVGCVEGTRQAGAHTVSNGGAREAGHIGDAATDIFAAHQVNVVSGDRCIAAGVPKCLQFVQHCAGGRLGPGVGRCGADNNLFEVEACGNFCLVSAADIGEQVGNVVNCGRLGAKFLEKLVVAIDNNIGPPWAASFLRQDFLRIFSASF